MSATKDRFPDWMSASDALTWHVERDPMLRSSISSVWWLESAPERDRFERTVERMIGEVPRLRQRVVADPMGIASPRWVEDRHFRLDGHVHYESFDGSASEDEVLALASRNHSTALDRDRALWNLHLVDGLQDGRAAVVLKLHHSIGDGQGLVKLGATMLDLEADPRASRAPSRPDEPTKSYRSEDRSHLVDAMVRRAQEDTELAIRAQTTAARNVARFALDPIGMPVRVGRTLRSIAKALKPASKPLSRLMSERSLDFSFDLLTFPLEEFQRPAKETGSTVNDVFMAGLVGGFQQYHQQHQVDLEQLRVSMPISIRDRDDDRAGNQFVPARLVLDADIEDPTRRLEVLRAQLREERAEPGLPYFNEVSELISRLGPSAATSLVSGMMKASDVTASNVQGVPVPVYLAGVRIERMVPFGPCAGAAVNVTLLSYAGEVAIGINCDRAAVPDPTQLTAALADSFRELFVLSSSS